MPSSSQTTTSGSTASKFIDIAMKVLSGLVIPLMVWGVKLEVTNAIQDERISELQEDLDKLADVTETVQKNTLTLVRLEGKLDNVNEKIDEVKKLLRGRE
jgi:uncharacterized coiled-coil protein SlyX